MKDKQLEGVIRFQKVRVATAKQLGTPSIEALSELTVKYLEELQSIKEKEVKGEKANHL